MTNKSIEEQKEILDEMLEDYFAEYPKSWRAYIFTTVFTSSIGKTKIPVAFECGSCGKKKQILFNLTQPPLTNPVIETAGIKIEFDFPEEIIEDKTKMILDSIRYVEDSEAKYSWEDLDEPTKMAVIDSIDFTVFESLINQMSPIHFELNYGCCERHKAVYNDILDVFKLLLNPDEVFAFYQVNHLLVKNHYTMNSIMGMIPIERNIALSLVEKDLKK